MPIPSLMTPKRLRATSSSRQRNDDSARTHVLLFANNCRNAFMTKVGKSFRGMLEQSGFPGRFRGAHCGRKIDQPFRIDGETAHDFERSHRILCRDGDVWMQACADETFANDVFQV